MEDQLRRLYQQGIECYRNGQRDQAEQLLSEFILKIPGYADVHNILGVLLSLRGETEQAIAHLRRALELNPDYTEARVNLMAVLDEAGRLEEAERLFDQMKQTQRSSTGLLDPYTEGKLANLHRELGEMYAGVGFHDEAIVQFRRALQLKPDFADIRVKLGVALRDKGYTAQAVEAFEQALKDKPQQRSAAIQLGITYYNMEKIAEAVAQWKSVLEKEPDHKLARIYLDMASKKGVA